jgi:hypothetical protein
MTEQLEITPAGSFEIISPPKDDMPAALAEEFETIAKRVRKRLKNMTTDIIEIGRELHAVKLRLDHGQFLNWVETACELSPRTAQLMMRTAEWAEGKYEIVAHLEPTAIYLLAAPSTPETVRQEVLSRLEEGQRPAPQAVKDMIRAAKEKKLPTKEKTGQAANPAQLRVAQSDSTQVEGTEGQEPQLEYAQTEPEQPATARQKADAEQAEPPRPEAPRREETRLQQVSPKAGRQRYPDIDPFKDHDPPWINGALRLIPLLAEAIPLTETIPNRDAIVDGAIELIPPLAEAVLQLQDITQQRLIEGLLKYCGYRDYANRVLRHSGQTTETTLRAGRKDGLEVGCDVTIEKDVGAAALPNAGTTAAITFFVKGLEVTEAADVT